MNTVLHIISGLGGGGAEGVLFRICSMDKTCNHEVISLTDNGIYGEKLDALGIPVYCVGLSRSRFSILKFYKLYKMIRDSKAQVIQCWMYHADFIGGLLSRTLGNRRIIWNVRHSELTKETAGIRIRFLAKLCAMFSNIIPDNIIYCAEKSRLTHRRLGYKKNGVVIPNGYDFAVFKPNLVPLELKSTVLNKKTDSFIIGTIARYTPEKDYYNLLKAINILGTNSNDFKLILVGEGIDQENEELMGYASNMSIEDNLVLLGYRDDIPSILNILDLSVLSSSSEGFPNVVAEAMSCEIPVVTTDAGDAREIVGDLGWIVPIKSPYALSEAISQAWNEKINSRDSWERRKLQCRESVVSKYDIRKMIGDYHKVWFE